MKCIKFIFIVFAITFLTATSYSQTSNPLETMPTTKEAFIKSEPQILKVIDWLENTPLNQETENRKPMNATLMEWITNSPTVTLELNLKVTPMSKKNPDLLMVFMGGWTKYALQNNYSKDQIKGTLAGIKSVIKLYKMGGGIKKDKDIEKLIDLDTKNELEAWITTQLAPK